MPDDPPIIRGVHAQALVGGDPPIVVDAVFAGPPPIIVEDITINSIAMGDPVPKQTPPSAHVEGWIFG